MFECDNQIGIKRVVVGITDPDERVSGSGLEALRSAGIIVEAGQNSDDVARQRPLPSPQTHRQTVCSSKTGCDMDGRTAAPDGSAIGSQVNKQKGCSPA